MLKWLSGGSSSSSRSSQVGKVFHIGQYHVVVEDVIAEGGFALVYKVKTAYGQRYALKRVAVNNEQDLLLLRQEIAITRAISDCPHSVTFVTSSINPLGKDVSEVLILMHLYTGGHLIDIMNKQASKGGFTEEEVLKIFTDVCQAVARLHHRTKPIIHRDLKVENILRDASGNFVLCDYGSCSLKPMHPEVQGSAELEDQISRFTTMAYRAPEMVSLFSGRSITTKADVWALGCLLYKLCFYTTPFGEQVLAIVSGTFSIPEDSRYSDNVHSLIRYMLEPDAEKRPNVWQVCEVAFRMRHMRNPIANVFNSVPPPACLPSQERRKSSDAPVKGKPPSGSTQQATPLTSNSSQSRLHPPLTTTISSRERPRARQMTHAKRSRSPDPRGSNHLVPPTTEYNHCKSLDSGLDAFGAVPFTPTLQPAEEKVIRYVERPSSAEGRGRQGTEGLWMSSGGGEQGASQTPEHLRRDLFGATPFASEMDAFGSTPFAACSQLV